MYQKLTNITELSFVCKMCYLEKLSNNFFRIKWDTKIDPGLISVGYLDRFIGTVESDFNRFDWDSDLASVGPKTLAIPEHRIKYFKYCDDIVWDKSKRFDAVFGSSGTKKTIHDLIMQQKT